jgi:hypothetical protein
MDVAQMFQEGGTIMLVILLVGLLSAVTGLLALAVRRRWAGILALVCGLLALGVGGLGFGLAMAEGALALQTVAADQYALAQAKIGELARIPLYFGAAWAVPGVLGGLIGLALSRGRATR